MYIKNAVLETHVSAYRPNEHSVTLTLDCVDSKQVRLIRDMYHARQDIRISPQDKTFANYCANDANVTYKTFSFGELWKFKHLKIVKVIYNKPATIVFWSDDTKTVVKCDKKDKYDPEKGFYIACAKKLFGNNFKAVGKINKALKLAVDENKKEK